MLRSLHTPPVVKERRSSIAGRRSGRKETLSYDGAPCRGHLHELPRDDLEHAILLALPTEHPDAAERIPPEIIFFNDPIVEIIC